MCENFKVYFFTAVIQMSSKVMCMAYAVNV